MAITVHSAPSSIPPIPLSNSEGSLNGKPVEKIELDERDKELAANAEKKAKLSWIAGMVVWVAAVILSSLLAFCLPEVSPLLLLPIIAIGGAGYIGLSFYNENRLKNSWKAQSKHPEVLEEQKKSFSQALGELQSQVDDLKKKIT